MFKILYINSWGKLYNALMLLANSYMCFMHIRDGDALWAALFAAILGGWLTLCGVRYKQDNEVDYMKMTQHLIDQQHRIIIKQAQALGHTDHIKMKKPSD